MPKRIPVQSIIVTRDEKRVECEIGKPFDFTAAEIKEIEAVNPKAIRKIINEDPAEAADTAADVANAVESNKAGKGKKAQAEGEGDL